MARDRHAGGKREERRPRAPLKKRLGQHILRDPGAARRIVRALGVEPGDVVLEIGPGRGALTRPLLGRGAVVAAVERDPAMVEELERELGHEEKLFILTGDVLRISLPEVCRAHNRDKIKVIGNIPYRITSPIIHWLLAQLSWVSVAVLTVQREVADRLLASPGCKSYGALTLAVAQRAGARRVFDIAAGAFRPVPRVDSTVVRLVPLARPAVEVPDETFLEGVIRQSFGQRRKMLRRSLLNRGWWSPEELEQAAAEAGVTLNRRPEELTLQEFGRLSRALWDLAGAGRGNAP